MDDTKDLYLEERRQEILHRLKETGRVSVTELSHRLGVSAVTIRTDLQALAEQNLLIRTHGGAIPAPTNQADLALAIRQGRQVAEKQRIGQAAAAMVGHGDALVLDSSSTALAIVPHLKSYRQLTIVTNSLAVAQALQDSPTINVVLPGGRLQHDTASLVGTEGLAFLQKYNLQKGFFGAHGFALPEGLTDVSAAEAEIKQALAAMCRQTIAVLDATKWGRVGLASFAPPEAVDVIITNSTAPSDLISRTHATGIDVVLV